MSVNGVSKTGFDFSLLNQKAGTAGSSQESGASFALLLADFKAQTLGTLMGSGKTAVNPLTALSQGAGVSGSSAVGRNTALFDPESAYRMMSVINQKDVAYKAQYSELSQMQSSVAEMQQYGQSLGSISASTGNDSIASRLQAFVGHYNDWVRRFDTDMQSGGVLAGTQAAQVSRYELEQSVGNMFNGATDGLHGLRDLGLSVDPTSGLASLDTTKLDAVLSSNKQGVVDTVHEFSANFARSAELLDSGGNFIARQLDNLGRAIHYIDANQPSLQAEFGTGDTAKPSGQIAQALAAYNLTYGV